MVNSLLSGNRTRNPNDEFMEVDSRANRDLKDIKDLASSQIQAADVVMAYRLLLGRPPENEQVVAEYVNARISSVQLYDRIIRSPEFVNRRVVPSESSLPVTFCGPALAELFSRFEPYLGAGQPGFVVDFLGIRTRVEFSDRNRGLDGVVEGYPIPRNCLADSVEWGGVMRAVFDAEDEITAIELGAGWSPWLVICATAAKKRGIQKSNLIGVEAIAEHCEYMRLHFRDNGLDPDDHLLLHGVAGAEDGTIPFPAVAHPSIDYGATLTVGNPLLPRPIYSGEMPELRVYSLTTLIAPHELVDLVHIDVQGSERDIVLSSLSILAKRVRRMVIGTHSRAIEQTLLEDLSALGWVLEADQSCRYVPHLGGVTLEKDGCQIWRNPNL